VIHTGYQRWNTGKQPISKGEKLLFNISVGTIKHSVIQSITYNNGIFTIPNVSDYDYLITWNVSMKTSTKRSAQDNTFQFVVNYRGGEALYGVYDTELSTTGMLNGHCFLHIMKKSPTDILYFYLQNQSDSTIYLATTNTNVSTSTRKYHMVNACICIFSVDRAEV